MDAVRELAQLVDRCRQLGGRRRDERLRCLRIGPDSWAEQAKLHAERDEPLLRAVVQVSLEPTALLIAGADDPRPRRAQLVHPGSQLGRQPFVLERDPGGGDDRVEQFALLCQRRVVDDRGNALTVLLHHGQEPLAIVGGKLELLAVAVGVGAELRQPVRQGQRRISERFGEGGLQWPAAHRAQIDQQVSDRGARNPRPPHACEKHDRNEHETDERRPDEIRRLLSVNTPCRISPPRKSSVSAPAAAGALARRTGRVAFSHRATSRIARQTDAANPSELAALSIALATCGFGQTSARLRGISANSIHTSASTTSATTNAPITNLSLAAHRRRPPGNQTRSAANVMIQ